LAHALGESIAKVHRVAAPGSPHSRLPGVRTETGIPETVGSRPPVTSDSTLSESFELPLHSRTLRVEHLGRQSLCSRCRFATGTCRPARPYARAQIEAVPSKGHGDLIHAILPWHRKPTTWVRTGVGSRGAQCTMQCDETDAGDGHAHVLRCAMDRKEGLTEILLAGLDLLFGCHHSHLSRVFTIRGQTYQVCCDCGAEFKYSLSTMSIERRLRGTSVPTMPSRCVKTKGARIPS
jgi:hypothetical protein